MQITGTKEKISNSLTIKGDLIPRKQLHLSKQAKAKTIKFIKLLFNSGIKDAFVMFSKEDRLELKLKHDADPDMTLEKFISMLTKYRIIKLQIGSPEPGNEIRFCAINESYGKTEATRLLWFRCKLNKENYKIVNQFFKEAYGKSIEQLQVKMV